MSDFFGLPGAIGVEREGEWTERGSAAGRRYGVRFRVPPIVHNVETTTKPVWSRGYVELSQDNVVSPTSP